MNSEPIILFLLGLLQLITLGVAGYIATTVIESGRKIERLTATLEGYERDREELNGRVGDLEDRVQALEIRQAEHR